MISLSSQDTTAGMREGVPYWIFWLLLSLIVLLLIFIFLRDKDFRRRLSVSLAGTKQRLHRKQIQARLAREKRRRIYLCREVGRTIWAGRIEADKFGPEFERLSLLEAQIAARHAALQAAYDEISGAEEHLEEVRINRHSLRKQTDSGDKTAVPAARARREDERTVKRRIRDLQKSSKAERKRLRKRSGEKSEVYERLGALADERRIEHPDLQGFYGRIDQANRAVLATMDKIAKLE